MCVWGGESERSDKRGEKVKVKGWMLGEGMKERNGGNCVESMGEAENMWDKEGETQGKKERNQTDKKWGRHWKLKKESKKKITFRQKNRKIIQIAAQLEI